MLKEYLKQFRMMMLFSLTFIISQRNQILPHIIELLNQQPKRDSQCGQDPKIIEK